MKIRHAAPALATAAVLFVLGCQSVANLEDPPPPGSNAFVIVHLQGSRIHYDSTADLSVYGPSINVRASCVGSPCPRILSVEMDGSRCIPKQGSASTFFGISFEGYHVIDSIYEKQHVAVITDQGIAEADISLPRQRLLINNLSSDITFGSPVTVHWTGDAEHYRVTCDLQNISYDNFGLIDTVVDDTILSLEPSALPDSLYGFDVALNAFNGTVPRPGAVGNMSGSLRGFIYAENIASMNYYAREFFIVH